MPLTHVERTTRWRKKHPEKDKELHIRYYNNHKEESYARVVRFRLFKSECKRLMNILID